MTTNLNPSFLEMDTFFALSYTHVTGKDKTFFLSSPQSSFLPSDEQLPLKTPPPTTQPTFQGSGSHWVPPFGVALSTTQAQQGEASALLRAT